MSLTTGLQQACSMQGEPLSEVQETAIKLFLAGYLQALHEHIKADSVACCVLATHATDVNETRAVRARQAIHRLLTP